LRVPGAKNIFTFHDLVPLRLPFTTLDRKHIYFRLVEKIAREADHIVTVSETSKKDIINVLGVPEQKVTNTYESVEIPEKYLSLDEATLTDELKGAFRLEYKGFLLFYGAIEPKKNVGRMIEAYLASNISMPFVIVGAAAWKSEQELRLLVDDNIRSLVQVGHETLVKRRVIRLDYVTFPQLVNLIRGARCLLFASLYEGFGLPILEAMICHTPVITSDLGSTKEIAGDAAILVDPYDTRDIRNAIIAATTNDELLAQKVAKGRKTSERFSAENYRRRLAELYGRVTSAL
jgi:glycosyltransferase involved in cell wall biosynthesis